MSDTGGIVSGAASGAASGSVLGPWGSVIGAAIGGLSSFFGGRAANQASAKSALQQMAFQEYMSNTAHQREVQDLRKAGLNPILSARGAGASTPGGASYTATDIATPASASALAAARNVAEVENLRATTPQILASTDQAKADANLKREQGLRTMKEAEIAGEELRIRRNEADASAFAAGKAESEAKRMGYAAEAEKYRVPLVQSEAARMSSSAKREAIEAGIDAQYRRLEREIEMGSGATSAVRNIVPGLNWLSGGRRGGARSR